MSHKDKKIEKLAQLAADGENTIVYTVNLDFLSNEEIEGYEEKRILLFLGYRSETTCSQCIKGSCTVPVKRAEYPDGRKMAVYRCPDPDHGGRFEIELDQLRHWKINIEVLKEMGYLTEAKLPVADELISLTDAGKILGIHSGNIARLVENGKIKDNGLIKKKRKVFKSSVLLEKSRRDRKGYEEDVDDLQADAGSIQEEGY